MQTRINNAYKIYEDNGIIHVLIHDGTNLQYNDAKEIETHIKNFSGKVKYLKLFDARGSFGMEHKTKCFFESPKVKFKIAAQAVLISGHTQQEIIDLFSEMNSSKLATKLFVNYDEAIKWLNTFKAK